MFSVSQSKLDRVMKATRKAMEDVGLVWNDKKCSVANVKRRTLDAESGKAIIGDDQVIKALKEGESYTFLGVLKNTKQEDELVLWGTSKVYL